MAKWIKRKKFNGEIKFKNPILVEGLPGVGNVGKIAVDYMIDELQPKLLYTIYSYEFPHSVYITEQNLIDLPSVSLYHYPRKGRDLLLLAGDIQPVDERANYEFCDEILNIIQKLNCKEVITLGGISLPEEPKRAKVFGTATNSKNLDKYKKCEKVNFKIDGKVGTIVGVSGLLLGLAKLRDLDGAAFLVETFGHPYHLGLKESKELITVLNDVLELKLDIEKLVKDIAESEKEDRKKAEEAQIDQEKKLLKKLKSQFADKSDTSYIG